MPTWVQSIEANAAAKLPLPGERHAPLELEPYLKFLKVESHRLQRRHRSGAGGQSVCRGHAALIDAVLRNLWQRATNSLSPQAQKEFPPLALVALGGYGRGALNPRSDLDVMFLHYGQVVVYRKPLPHLSKMIDWILLPLFDLGLKVGHSVRTIEECVQLANRDMQTKTSLIEARLVVGHAGLFSKFEKAILAKCVQGHVDEYLEARLQDQANRRAKFGNSPTMQEPNVKNGCGGLRDFQNLMWMAFFKHRTRSLAELQGQGFLTAQEVQSLDGAYDFLLRVRNELHYQTGRPSDVLTRGLQAAVAHKLGYADRSPRRRLEAFMRHYYRHSRNIYLITRTLEERLALLPKETRIPAFRRLMRRPLAKVQEQLVDGFACAAGQINASSSRVFRDQPRRMMRVFLHAQQRGLRLHPDLAQLIRNQRHLVDRKFQRDPHVRETFLEILNQRGNVAGIVRAMHEVALLGKYLPEFGKMTCLVQHEFYHQYTADEHTLVCLEKLDQIWEAQRASLARYAEEFQKVERPFILYLAMLLHDAGKAHPGGPHSEVGGQLALKVARRLDLDGATAHALCLLIQQHLSMAQISQRRDLGDRVVIRHFANLVQSVENLRMLALHTVADSLATSDKLWNGFKDSLLWDLYGKAMDELTGARLFLLAGAKQRELLKEEVSRRLPRQISPEERAVHFQALPARYYEIHSTRDIVTDLVLVHRFISHQVSGEAENAFKPVLAWQNKPDRGFTVVRICSWDRAGLFSIITGSFGAAGINILSAQAFTRQDDIVLDTFSVNHAEVGGPIGRAERESFEDILFRALTQGGVDFSALINRRKPGPWASVALSEDPIPLRIGFDNDASEDRTVIEIETEDGIGLLYAVSQVLTDLQLDISLAKILTEKGAAIDSFYVSEPGGGQIRSAEREREIEAKLRAVLRRNRPGQS